MCMYVIGIEGIRNFATFKAADVKIDLKLQKLV